MAFRVPEIYDNPDGWGPSNVVGQVKSIPYAPYNKGERVGRVADWSGQANYRGARQRQPASDTQVNSAFFFTQENEDDFQLVDMSKPTKRYGNHRRFYYYNKPYWNNRNRRGRQDEAPAKNQPRQKMSKAKMNARARYMSYRRWGNQFDHKPPREASVHVRKDWKVVQEFPLGDLQKAEASIQAPEDLAFCGKVQAYDDAYDRVGTRSERVLERKERTFFNVTTSDDPVIQELAKGGKGNVFGTDTILAVLMCATRSVYSWDILVRREGNNLYFDKRENSQIDFLTVDETAAEPPTDDKEDDTINNAQSLSREATYVNQNFSQQVLSDSKAGHEFERSNPFLEEENPDETVASVAYRYRRFPLAGGEYNIVVRTELDGMQVVKTGEKKGTRQYFTIKALNEYDPKKDIDWRQKLDIQRGAVVATELRNNSCKLARWTIQSLLSGSSTLKLGFVTRMNSKSNKQHVVLGTQFYKPKEFATQIHLNIRNSWGILKTIIDACMKLDEGEYVLLKDPNKPLLQLYDVPPGGLDGPDAEEEEEEEAAANPMLNFTSLLSGASFVPDASVPVVHVARNEKNE
eukprot:CAMPEP_0119132946 /NCGR_PEP_ID=MMETSP1310-20130426/12664_1 /TAXON_ID=464262 /ORGANISM="Genus nov. species nov., Strain RCC2339" /LENGTH=575 /DNA_ID=CAMNT_0007123615 /DNA_START=61 /DNA_END=1788 /DNA_ORIENTATION=+